jgi:hypothetical protein
MSVTASGSKGRQGILAADAMDYYQRVSCGSSASLVGSFCSGDDLAMGVLDAYAAVMDRMERITNTIV